MRHRGIRKCRKHTRGIGIAVYYVVRQRDPDSLIATRVIKTTCKATATANTRTKDFGSISHSVIPFRLRSYRSDFVPCSPNTKGPGPPVEHRSQIESAPMLRLSPLHRDAQLGCIQSLSRSRYPHLPASAFAPKESPCTVDYTSYRSPNPANHYPAA
jgi:hypothetical protein